MDGSSKIAFALVAGFAVFITTRGELPAYLCVIGIGNNCYNPPPENQTKQTTTTATNSPPSKSPTNNGGSGQNYPTPGSTVGGGGPYSTIDLPGSSPDWSLPPAPGWDWPSFDPPPFPDPPGKANSTVEYFPGGSSSGVSSGGSTFDPYAGIDQFFDYFNQQFGYTGSYEGGS